MALFIAAFLICGMLTGCGSSDSRAVQPQQSGQTEGFPVTVTDMLGREVRIEKQPEKIIALTAGECEIVYALGAGDLLVGRGEYCDFPAQALDVASVRSGYETNIEQIVALGPDLIITNSMDESEETIAQIESLGIPVLESCASDICGVYTSIGNIGKALGKEADAEAIISGMKASFDELAEAASGKEKKTVYFEVSPLEWGLWTAGSGTFMDEAAAMVGLENCFSDVEGWSEISEEQVLQRDPDVIVTISMYYGDGPTPTEEILSRSGWENLTAIKNQAVLNLQNNELTRPSVRLAEGARQLYTFVWGE